MPRLFGYLILSGAMSLACSESKFQADSFHGNRKGSDDLGAGLSNQDPANPNIGDSQQNNSDPNNPNNPYANKVDTFVGGGAGDAVEYGKCAAKWGPLPTSVNKFVLTVINISDIKDAKKTLNLDYTKVTEGLETVYIPPVAITGALNTINVRLMNPKGYYCLSQFAMIGSLNTINVYVHCDAKIADTTPSLNIGYKNNAGGSSIGSFNNLHIFPRMPDGSNCAGS